MRAVGIAVFSVWAAAAPAQGLLSEAELRECLAGFVEFSTVSVSAPDTKSVFNGRRTPPLGEDTEWRRKDRVLTIENTGRRAVPFVPYDPGYPSIYQQLHFRHFLAAPIISLSLHGEAGPIASPIGIGASLVLFPGGLAPYAPFNQHLALSLPRVAAPYPDVVELRLLPLDVVDASGQSFMRDFGEALCAPKVAPDPVPETAPETVPPRERRRAQ